MSGGFNTMASVEFRAGISPRVINGNTKFLRHCLCFLLLDMITGELFHVKINIVHRSVLLIRRDALPYRFSSASSWLSIQVIVRHPSFRHFARVLSCYFSYLSSFHSRRQLVFVWKRLIHHASHPSGGKYHILLATSLFVLRTLTSLVA